MGWRVPGLVVDHQTRLFYRHQKGLAEVLVVLERPAFGITIERSTECAHRLGAESQPDTIFVVQLIDGSRNKKN